MTTSQRTCGICGVALTGRQTLWCSTLHGAVGAARRKQAQRTVYMRKFRARKRIERMLASLTPPTPEPMPLPDDPEHPAHVAELMARAAAADATARSILTRN